MTVFDSFSSGSASRAASVLAAKPSADEAVQQVQNWWESDLAQHWLIDTPIAIGITLVVAVVSHWVFRRLIDKVARHNMESQAKLPRIRRKTKGEHPEEVSARVRALNDSQEKRRKSRIKTLAAVGKSAVAILVWTWAALTILDQLGVNIAPIIASAGVVGVALGFGAQSLVKDFISGIFMLLEDQYGVGDTIDVGDGIIGDVEDISLRLTTLRDIDGTLWYVRNGEILRVGNFSDEFSIARIQIPVSLSNDYDQAWDVIKNAVTEAVELPSLRSAILEEPSMNGLTNIEPDHISYRISVKTLPGQQWTVQREIQAHVLKAMRERGVSTPYPHGIGIDAPQLHQEH